MMPRTQKIDIMKTRVVFLALALCSLLLMPGAAEAQTRLRKSSCLNLIYPVSPTTSIKRADNYKGPTVEVVKKNLKKLTGNKRKTNNHDHPVSETFANYDRMKKRSR